MAGVEWFADLLAEGKYGEAFKEIGIYFRYAGVRETLRRGFIQRAVYRAAKRIPFMGRIRRHKSPPPWLSPDALNHWRSSNELPSFDRNPDLLFTASAGEIYNTNRHGVELRYPYHDQRVIEYVASLPGYQLYSRYVYKIILRNAMRGILPEAIRTRRQQTSLIPFFASGTEKERDLWESYLHNKHAAWRKFIREEFLIQQWGSRMAPENDGPNYVIPWLCVSFETWHTAHFSSN
jgi:hypothetical protein